MAFAVATIANAEEYGYLSFQKIDGSVVSVGVEGLTIIVSEGRLVVANAAENQEIALDELAQMFFSTSTTSGISEIAAEHTGNKTLRAYTLAGVYVGEFATIDEAKSELGSGMYVVKDNDNTTKIAVK